MDLKRITKEIAAPLADMFDGDPTTDALDCSNANAIRLLIHKSATAGTATITLEKCDSDKGNNTAIAFNYREIDDGVAGDMAAATTAGFTSLAATTLIEIFVKPQALGSSQYLMARLTEVVNTACVGGVLADVEPRASH